METRVAVIAIIVEDSTEVETLNAILHEFADYIIGRVGIPYRQRGINIITVAVDAPQNVISAMSGRIGRLEGITAKTTYSK
jgi:putative iron-only hydrogenase system regulator